MPSDMVPTAVGLLSSLVALLAGLTVLRACRSRVVHALIAVTLGLLVIFVVGGAADRLPAELALLLPVLLAVKSVAVALCAIGAASLAPGIIGFALDPPRAG